MNILIRAAANAVVLTGVSTTVLSAQRDVDATRALAEQGYAFAQFSLGFMYDTGDGVAEDDAEAARWYRMAAEQPGGILAQYHLGLMYADDESVIEDDVEAARWYRMAAEQGYSPAQFSLGFMYDTGDGVAADDAEAARWYRMAAEQGDTRAQVNLGFMYANGMGVLKDAVQAHMWLNIAGANSSDEAREARDRLEAEMTSAEIRRATDGARACMATDYEQCEGG